MSNIKLIVNADDWGQSAGINAGIIEAYENGIVTSASLMVRYPAATEAVEYSMNNPGLSVGLHADLGEWYLKDGEWLTLYEVVPLDNYFEVEQELNRQLECFYRVMNRIPTHLDSHQHVHMQESLKPIFMEIAQKMGITLRRCSTEVNYCGNFYGQLADGSPYHDAISVEGLQKIFAGLPEGITEMACHPGLNIDITTMYHNERLIEVNTLCTPAIRETLVTSNIKLCSFNDIPL